MAKETKKENTQIAADIAKNVYDILNKHIIIKTIYGDAKQVAQNQIINNANLLMDDLANMFNKKYAIAPFNNLNNMSWQEIKNIVKEGNADKIFNIGDTKEIMLYTGEKVEVVIVGFNHDTISDSTDKAGITFGFKNLIDGRFEINETDTNKGGWANSKMRNVYMQRLFALLPKDLQDVIVTIDKVTGIGDGENKIETTQDKLFLFSKREVFGNSADAADFEGCKYPYFEKEENKIAYRAGDTDWWWLRSPYVSDSHGFCGVDYYGYANNFWASYSDGVRPAFSL